MIRNAALLSLLVFFLSATAYNNVSVGADNRADQDQQTTLSAPIVTAFGSLDGSTVDRYDSIAVFFQNAPGVPGSGTTLEGTLTEWLLAAGFTVVERSRTQQLLDEQRNHSPSTDETARAIHASKLSGAKAVVFGSVSEWKEDYAGDRALSSVTLGFRIVDVANGTVLFHGQAYYPRPLKKSPQAIAHILLTNVIAHMMATINGGWLGYAWKLIEQDGKRLAVITDVLPGTPSQKAGLKVGDVILACNGLDSTNWNSRRQFYEVCRVEPGQGMLLTVERGGEPYTMLMTAIDRRQWYRDRSRAK